MKNINIYLTFTFFVLLACGDNVLFEVTEFSVNNAPEFQSYSVQTSSQVAVTEGSLQLLPGMIFLLNSVIDDKEKDIISIEYDSEITNSTEKVIFNNTVQSDFESFPLTASATASLPDTLPLNEKIYIDFITKDAKLAETIKRFYLGPVKLAPVITIVTAASQPYSTPIQVSWQADSDGFYQHYLLNDSSQACTIVRDNALILVFNYSKNQQITSNFSYTVTNKKLCILVFDALNQVDIKEYLL